MHSDLYPAEYFLGGSLSNYHNYGDDPGWFPTVKTLQQFLKPGSSILEVGCATGWFVQAARQAGFDAVGIDVSQWAIEHPAPGAEGHIFQASVIDLAASSTTPRKADRMFDAVVSWEMLEHVPEDLVSSALAAMFTVTRSDGLWVHRIALEDAADHHAHDDVTHFTIKPRQFWRDQFAVYDRLSLNRTDFEANLDSAIRGRDWAGRFFAYEFVG
jgi:cyclopropane fatty-acyl-phospholipid synthase-like methyltransferase